ncbi:M3 family metallopeptidase [Massilia sp. TS11]|uniref:M3 family metallopeptidase n=1 Tax=Massilia sp. TS11 TaxID=2908003 RepID=UPI001EDA4C7D|nr:M3 family metallopeptidase [Massilia sp. TS11]MCG2585083.1 M3 family metallopeptidase [Massilia sp. TS11]
MKKLMMAAAVAFAFLGGAAHAALDPANPFAKPSTLPLGYPAFDKIKNEHFMPAYVEGMAEQVKEVEAIANNPAKPTFQNTIVALEKSGQLLSRVATTFSNLNGTVTNDAMQAIDRELAPKLSAHSDFIRLNDKLWQRVNYLYERKNQLGLDAEAKYLLERYHTDFVRAGAQLSAADKEKLKAYNSKLAELQTKFAQNVLKEANASAMIVDTKEELDGMSEAAIKAAADLAKKMGKDGKFAIAIVNTSGQPPLAVLKNRAVRERLMGISMARGIKGGEYDNREVVLQIVKLRAERAKLLGYKTYADFALEDQTAHSATAVNSLLSELAKPAVANAKKEAAELQKLIDAENGGFQLAAWDWDYYADKLRAQKYSFDAKQLKPYFEMNSVMVNGVFYAANKVYGISFKERKDLPVYTDDVKVFDVFDRDGKQLAIFIADMYARPSKRGGAWMNAYVSQSKLMGTKPVVANHLNIPKPPAGEPTLLTYDEVRTMFHEFGHALHGMFSNVTYPRFSGTRVPRDFVEFPSQVNEMWMTWPEILKNYARHYQTGAPMPTELLDKVQASARFNEGYRTTEYLAASILDQRWHQLTPEQMPTDVVAFEAQALKEAGVDFAPVPTRYRTAYFSHTFAGGYSAGYYGYVWAERLDADTVEWFKEHGGLQRKNGDLFREKLLSRGGTMDAMQMFKNVRGREPNIKPLLERRGLTAQ